MGSYAHPETLVDTGWLAKHLGDPQLAIAEVDEDPDAYGAGHIPGAVGIDWQRELHAPPQRDFVSAAQLAALLGAKGISSDQTLVLYGGNNNWFAAYAYWLCKLRGVEHVKLLDGGRKKWELEDRPLTTEVAMQRSAAFTTGVERPELRIFRDEVMARGRQGGGMLIDVRSPEEFSGSVLAPPHLPQEQPYVGGHIPGAHNIPWIKAVRDDGAFKSADELRALYEGAGTAAADVVIAYCRIGERSSHTWFVLHELLGHAGARNYDGSWTEYGSMVGVPVER
ncbi:MAG TPA: sulfurtransferase [Euzebya sp.]|nr:sulfurtransferase [Euzebya sp.]